MVTLNRHSTRVGCVLRFILFFIGILGILGMIVFMMGWLRGEFEYGNIIGFMVLAAIAYACLRITITGNGLFLMKFFMNVANSQVVQKGQDKLMKAISKGHTEKVQALLAKGADVNTRGNDGFTALDMAAGYGHTDIVQALLAQDADVKAKDNDGITALMGAAFEGHTETVQTLLAKGADVNAKANDGSTAPKKAKEGSHEEVVRLLKEAGAKE